MNFPSPLPLLVVVLAGIVSGSWGDMQAATMNVANGAVAARINALNTSRDRLVEVFGQQPLYFIENRGQMDSRVSYYVQGHDKSVYFTPQGLTFVLTPLAQSSRHTRPETRPEWAVKLDFVGANPKSKPMGDDLTPALVSYFRGARAQWRTGIKTSGQIIYRDLWPGIDLVYAGTVNRLKYTFLVKPGADPDCIRLAYRGAADVCVNGGGQLEISTPAGGFHDDKPFAYQEIDGKRAEVAAAYAMKAEGGPRTEETAGNYEYGFNLGAYDRSKPLVLDPATLVYAGYIGGGSDDVAWGIAVNEEPAGSENFFVYVTGYTGPSATFPIVGGPYTTFGGAALDVFVAK